MRPVYRFRTSEFGVSNQGIHLLRSGYNYKTISFNELETIAITRGKELHNWWVIFIVGAAVVLFGIALSIHVINMVISDDFPTGNLRMLFVLFIPFVGVYFVYNSVQMGLVLKVKCSDGSRWIFPLKEIARAKQLPAFHRYLNDKTAGVRCNAQLQ